MRILFITERFPPQRGGVAVSAARQVAGLAPHCERLDVLQLTSDLPAGRVVASDLEGVARLFRIGRAPRDEESTQLLFETARVFARAHDHDLLVGFYAVWSGYIATLVGRDVRRPSVVCLRGNDVDRGMFQGSRAPFLDWTLRHADAITAVSSELVRRTELLVGPRDGLHFIANGVDVETFRPGAPDAGSIAALSDHPRPWLGFSGELRFKKGMHLLLDLAEARTRSGGTVFLLGGARGDQRAELDAWRRREPAAAEHLVEVPYTRDRGALVSAYNALDAVVLPSLWDGMPNALLEAMACARPVIATSAGGIGDVIAHETNGFIVPFEQLDRLDDHVSAVLTRDSNELQSIGAAARETVTSSFTIDREQKALLELFHNLCGAPR